jgi:cell division initiation protein
MSLTPVEIRHVKLPRRFAGYGREPVQRLLGEIVESFEDVWRDRADLRDEVERLEGELARFKELDVLLRNSLVSAERHADDLRAQAGKEADVIVEEARVRAREITAEGMAERERTQIEIRRLQGLESEMRGSYRAFLTLALDRLESDTQPQRAPGHAA